MAARYGDPLARDLHERVLPLLLPRFLRNSCQAPDAFVAGALVLAELWPDERVGNWPRAEQGGGSEGRGRRRTTTRPVGI